MSRDLYACVSVREFPVQAALRNRPDLRTRPVVVVEGEPPKQTVCSINAAARRLGIYHGMTRVELETFPAHEMLSRSRSEESTARSVLLEAAGSFSPRLEELSDATTFLCILDIAGTGKLFGPPRTLTAALLDRLHSLGLRASAAISSNFHAAILAARGSTRRIEMIEPGNEAAALAPLNLSVLALPEAHAQTFAVWGIRTLGALAGLPEVELIARMGQEGKRLRQTARGELPHHFIPIEAAFHLEEELELDIPIEQLELLLFGINAMLQQLIHRATARVLALASVTITLRLEGGATHARSVRPALPTNDRQLWIKLLHLDLEAHPPQAAILAVTLSAEPGSTSKVQLGLFSPQLPEPARLDVTLARIRAIVGEHCVGRPVLQDTHHPDACQLEPFTLPTASPASHPTPSPPAAMRLLRPPERIKVVLREGQPASFHFRDHRYEVARAYGPWLAGGGWWSLDSWAVEQWDLIAQSPDAGPICCCIVRDLAPSATNDSWRMVTLYD